MSAEQSQNQPDIALEDYTHNSTDLPRPFQDSENGDEDERSEQEQDSVGEHHLEGEQHPQREQNLEGEQSRVGWQHLEGGQHLGGRQIPAGHQNPVGEQHLEGGPHPQRDQGLQGQQPPPGGQNFSLSNPPKEWRSWKVKWQWMTALLVTEVLLIATIVALERVSSTQNGIVTVPQVSFFASSRTLVADIWRYGLLWTALPAFVFSLFASIMWGTAVNGTADRQPYIELEREANAMVTVMLDYRSYPPFYNWIVAWQKRHILIGFAMFLSFILTNGIVSLAAHLLVAIPTTLSSSMPLSFPASFSDSAFNSASNLQGEIDLANAIRSYGAEPPLWMTADYAFEPFSIVDTNASGNVTGITNAYSGVLDCQAYPPSDTITYNQGTVTVRINDRGCQLQSISYAVSNDTPIYAEGWNSQCQGSDYGRLAIVTGFYSDLSPTKLANASVISCIPRYQNTTGSLTVRQNASPQFVSFTQGNTTYFHDNMYQTFEDTIMVYSFFGNSNTFTANAFGLAVYNYAKSLNSSWPFQQELIQKSMEDIFSTIYAGLTTNLLLPPLHAPRNSTGTFSTAVTRLYVVTPIAYVIVGVLSAILICTIWLFYYAYNHKSALYAEPIGLIGSASLLHDSDVLGFVDNFGREHRYEYDMREFMKYNYNVEEAKCVWVWDKEKGRGRIVLKEQLKKLDPPKEKWSARLRRKMRIKRDRGMLKNKKRDI